MKYSMNILSKIFSMTVNVLKEKSHKIWSIKIHLSIRILFLEFTLCHTPIGGS